MAFAPPTTTTAGASTTTTPTAGASIGSIGSEDGYDDVVEVVVTQGLWGNPSAAKSSIYWIFFHVGKSESTQGKARCKVAKYSSSGGKQSLHHRRKT